MCLGTGTSTKGDWCFACGFATPWSMQRSGHIDRIYIRPPAVKGMCYIACGYPHACLYPPPTSPPLGEVGVCQLYHLLRPLAPPVHQALFLVLPRGVPVHFDRHGNFPHDGEGCTPWKKSPHSVDTLPASFCAPYLNPHISSSLFIMNMMSKSMKFNGDASLL